MVENMNEKIAENVAKELTDVKLVIGQLQEIFGEDNKIDTAVPGEKFELPPLLYGNELKINKLMAELRKMYQEEMKKEVVYDLQVFSKLKQEYDTEKTDKLLEMMSLYTGLSKKDVVSKFGLRLSCDVIFDFFEFSSVKSMLKTSKVQMMVSSLRA